jgi:hypothetical protein
MVRQRHVPVAAEAPLFRLIIEIRYRDRFTAGTFPDAFEMMQT